MMATNAFTKPLNALIPGKLMSNPGVRLVLFKDLSGNCFNDWVSSLSRTRLLI